MSLLQGWKGWRAFERLPWQWRNLVFYSESGQDWHQFSGLIEHLTEHLGRPVCYVTSDPRDQGLTRRHKHYRSICIPPGLFLTVFFQVAKADVFVLTMMDLDNLQLKRSVHPVYYVYLFHSMGSTHMADHANSFDHYDCLFCTGPHQAAEVRKREELHHLPAKHLFDYGHPRLEAVMEQAAHDCARSSGARVTTLVAPTWGESSIFNVCGRELIANLLAADFHVIMRPHYHTTRLTPRLTSDLRREFAAHPRFEYVDRMSETESMLRSDILISDWSAMALEYAFGLEKPVLFIDVPRRVRNPGWRDLGMEPLESSLRPELGSIVSPQRLHEVPASVRQLLNNRDDFSARMRTLRERWVFRLGNSVAAGAAELARLADMQLEQRLLRTAEHA